MFEHILAAFLAIFGFPILMAVIFGLPIFLIYLLYRFLRKRFGKLAILMPLLIFGIIVYGIYAVIFPDDDYFRGEFQFITGISLPENAIIRNKATSLPIDPHGDYCSSALIEVDENTYNQILEQVKADARFNTHELIGSEELTKVVGGNENERSLNFFYSAARFQKADDYNFIGFLDDGRTLLSERCVT